MSPLLGLSVTKLLQLIDKKEISSKDVWDFYKKRIGSYNKTLNIYLAEGENHTSNMGTLQGLPITLKDNIVTRDLPTTAASKILDGFMSPYEATVSKKLQEAGSSLLGKANLDAWSHGSSTETSDYGVTKNPYDHNRVAGGSSGGPAAAVASGLAPAAIGTETAGSIRQPCAWSGAVGLKPTYGRVSRYGIVAMGSSWDCPGPITQTVEDAAFLLEIISGQDPYDATTLDEAVPQYSKQVSEKKSFTIGIAKEYFENVHDDIKESVENAVKELKSLGHTVKEISLLDPQYAISVYMILQRSEVSSNLARYDGIRFGKNRSNFGEEAERRIMLGTYSLSHGYYDAYYKKALKARQLIAEDFRQAFKSVDLIIAPTTPMSATKIGEWEKYPFYGETMDVLLEPSSAAGIPAISLPIGLDSSGLPIGIQIMGNHLDEVSVLQGAYQLEQAVQFDRMKILKEKYS